MANTVSTEIIFSSPFFWKSGKICDFFTAAHKYIQDSSDERCKIFKEKLDSDAQSPTWNLWNGKANWRNVLEEEQFQLVTTYLEAGNADKLNDKYKPRKPKKYWQIHSVVELLGIIRNKHEHNGRFSDESKRKLNWFQFVNETFQFDPNLYAKYWIEKFPRLTLFLWVHFSENRDVPTLKAFYVCNVTRGNSEYFKLAYFMSYFNEALQDQMDTGAVSVRHIVKYDQTPILLEFRTLPANTITRLFDGSQVLKLTICQNNVSCHWMDHSINSEGFQYNQVINQPCSDTTMNCVTSMFANTIADIEKNVSEKIDYCHGGTAGTRIIIFTTNDSTDFYEFNFKCRRWVNTQFEYISDYPVSLEDISPSIQNIVKTLSEVCVLGPKIKLSKLLPEEINLKTKCLNDLSGYVLNTILKGETPKIFRTVTLPRVPSVYIKRKLQYIVVIDIETLKQASYKNIFVCVGLDKSHLKFMTNCNDVDITELEVLPKDPTFLRKFIIVRHYEFNEIEKGFRIHKNQNVHVVRYLQEQIFEWLETHGSTQILEQNCKHFKDDCIPKSEAKVLETVRSKEKLVLIADKPGMGKSVVLARLAAILAEKLSERLIIYESVTEFVKMLTHLGPLTKNNTMSILTLLCCCTDFENTLIHSWVLDSNLNSKPKIELMLDGFDETNEANKNVVIKAINILLNEISIVRVWITLRSHTLNELASKFGTYGYKLLPLSHSDKIELIVQLWLQYSNRMTVKPDIDKYRDFAAQCLQLESLNKHTEITDIPLFCGMIAEIYENKVLVQDLTVCSNTSLSELYINMFERKLEIYLKNKCGIESLAMNHIITSTMRENLERWNLYFAIKLIFPEQVSVKFISLLHTECSSQDEIKEAVLQFGLIEKLHPIIFIHRTFAEFLIGRFAFKILSKKVVQFSEDVLEEFLQNEVFRIEIHETKISNQLLAMVWKPQPICVFSYSVVNDFLNDLLRSSCEENELCSKSMDQLWDIGDRVVTGIVFRDSFVKMFPLMAAVCHSKLRSLFSYLLHDEQNMKAMIVLGLLSYHFTEITYIIKLGKYFQPLNWHELQSLHENGFGILHWSIYSFCHKNIWPEGEDLLQFFKFIASGKPELFEEQDKDGLTPLLMLVQSNFTSQPIYCQLIDFLLNEVHVNVHQTTNDNNTVIHSLSPVTPNIIGDIDKTILKKYGYILQKILKHEKNRYMLNVRNSSGHTPLLSLIHYFSEHRKDAMIHRENLKDEYGDYLFSQRYEKYCKTLVDVLSVFWKFGADFNVKFTDGRTALHFAITELFNRIVISGLAQLGSIYAKNNEGQCALHLAIIQKNLFFFMWLVSERSGDLNVCDYQGKSVLDLGVIQFVVHRGWQEYECTCNQSIINELKDVINHIVEIYPSSLEMQDSLGKTPLLVLFQEGLQITYVNSYDVFADLVYFFVKVLKANVNAVDKDGNTVLHFQTIKVFDDYKKYDPVKYLKAIKTWRSILCVMLKSGIQKSTLNLTNKQGKTPLIVIMDAFSNHPILVRKALKIFYKLGADFDTTDRNGNTLLMQAIKEEHDTKIVRTLILQYKANISIVNLSGECALSTALSKNNIETIKLLVEHCQWSYIINKRNMLTW